MTFQSAKQAKGSSNREAKGFLFLIVILIFPFVIQYAYRGFFYKPSSAALAVTYIDTCDRKPFDSERYINRPYQKAVPLNTPTTIRETKYVIIDINLADSIQFESLPGIGPIYASRILKFRKLLGGFMKVEQLQEVYGISPETFSTIQPLCVVSLSGLKKIAADSIWNYPYKIYHPYLSKELKAAIVSQKKSSKYSEVDLKQLLIERNEKLSWYVQW